MILFVCVFQRQDAFVSSESEGEKCFITQNITKVGNQTITVAFSNVRKDKRSLGRWKFKFSYESRVYSLNYSLLNENVSELYRNEKKLRKP